jgi:hypothetical protein
LAQLSLEQVAALGLELVQELALVQELELVGALGLELVQHMPPRPRSRLLAMQLLHLHQ